MLAQSHRLPLPPFDPLSGAREVVPLSPPFGRWGTEALGSEVPWPRQLSSRAAEPRREELRHAAELGACTGRAADISIRVSEETKAMCPDLYLGSPSQPGLCRCFEELGLSSRLTIPPALPLPSPQADGLIT